MTTTYVNWGDAKVKFTWVPDDRLPQQNLITSVHGLCFHDKKLLLVDLRHRGWDFPGGHIEMGETPEECFEREAMEEGYVQGTCHLFWIYRRIIMKIQNGMKAVNIQNWVIKYSIV